jgi:Uncharacterized protein conserved in bacteria (DUF2252)
LSHLKFRDEAPTLRHGARDSLTARRLRSIPSVHQPAERLATARHARADRPDRHVEYPRGLLIRSAFETDQEKHPALLLVNLCEGAIEIPQRQHLCRIGCRCRDWPRFVDPDDNSFPHAAMDAVCILVMHEGEEPGAEIGTALPEMLLRNRADESAQHLSPALGERMLAARFLDKAVFLRELLPQDLKLEIDKLTREEAMKVARYLAMVVGKAHARQMSAGTREKWRDELARNRSSTLDAPSWLWSSVVELVASHEAAYLDHCRKYAMESNASV